MLSFALGAPESILWAFLLVLLLGPTIMFAPRLLDRRYTRWIAPVPILLMAALLVAYHLVVYRPFQAGEEVELIDGGRQLLLVRFASLPVLTIGLGIAYVRRLMSSLRA